MNRWWIRLAMFAPPFWRGLTAIALLMILTAALNALKPWPLKLLVDYVFGEAAFPQHLNWIAALPGAQSKTVLVAWLAASTLIIFAAAWAIQTVHAYIQSGVALRMSYALGAKVFEQLQRLSLRFHSRRPTGDLVRRVTRDSRCARDLMIDVLLPAASAILSLLAIAVVMLQMNTVLTLITLLVVPAIVVAQKWLYPAMQAAALDQHQHEGVMLSQAEQALTVLPMVQSFRREAASADEFRMATGDTLKAYYRGLAAQLKFRTGVNGATTLGRTLVMVFGGYQVLEGQLTVGGLLVFLAYVGMLYDPLTTLANLSSGVATAEASAGRVFEVIDAYDVVPDQPKHDAPLSEVKGNIVFDSVSFEYEPGQPVLENIDFEISAGQTVAIVGPSGSGKTTLVSLLLRFFDPTSGRILLDGTDLRDLSLDELRSQISLLLQDPFLLPVTVAENIAYGRPAATREQIEQAAMTACADDFIRRLPNGYDTIVGERGASLSGGEKQRLAIARALLKDPPILILDEPTSALDASKEAEFIQALDLLAGDCTTILIAHRMSTIRHADTILVLDRGAVSHVGVPDELLDDPNFCGSNDEIEPNVQNPAIPSSETRATT